MHFVDIVRHVRVERNQILKHRCVFVECHQDSPRKVILLFEKMPNEAWIAKLNEIVNFLIISFQEAT